MSHRAHYLLSPNLIDELTPISSLRSSDLLVSLTVISKFSGAHGGSASSTTYSPTESERSDPPHRAHGHGRPATTQEYGNVIEPNQEDHGPTTSPSRPHSIDDAYPSTNGSVMSEGAEGPHHHHIPPDPKNVARRGPTYRQMQQTNCRQMQENCQQMQGDSCRRYKDWPPNLAMELLAGEWGTSEGDTTT